MENLDRVKEYLAEAAYEREKGDNLRDMDEQDEAKIAWHGALDLLLNAKDLLEKPEWNKLANYSGNEGLPTDQCALVEQLVETLGQIGGIHRRLEEYGDSLKSYEEGAKLEEIYRPTSTYNRVNYIKLSLWRVKTSHSETWRRISRISSTTLSNCLMTIKR